jgi:hypothetical protein
MLAALPPDRIATLPRRMTTPSTRFAGLAAKLFGTAAVIAAMAASLSTPGLASAAPAPKGFLGVNTSWTLTDDDYEQMAASNVGMLRTGYIFSSVKSAKHDSYDWSRFDESAEGAARNGIDMIPVLFGVPPWISTERGATPLGRAETDWRKYLTALVERYGPDGEFWALHPEIPYRPIEVWQVWNEPNSRTWWRPKPDPGEYGKLLALSAETIHEVDPQAKIMTAGIVAEPTNAAAIRGNDFLRGLFKSKAARNATDVVAFHPYAPTTKTVQKQLESARQTLKQAHMARTPIWVTEIGWGSEGPKDHPLIMPEATLEKELAKLLQMAVDQRRRLGLGSLLWYHWQDHPDDLCLWCVSSGLVDSDGVSKPLLDIFSAIARL